MSLHNQRHLGNYGHLWEDRFEAVHSCSFAASFILELMGSNPLQVAVNLRLGVTNINDGHYVLLRTEPCVSTTEMEVQSGATGFSKNL